MKANSKLFVIFICIVTCCLATVDGHAQKAKILQVFKSKPQLPPTNIFRIKPDVRFPKTIPKVPIVRQVNTNTPCTDTIKTGLIKAPKVLGLLEEQREKFEKEKKKWDKVMALINLTAMVESRFVRYAIISSQSVDTTDMSVFPMTQGQVKISECLENELRLICKDKNVTITRSKDQYVYVKIPSNISGKEVPSLMFMAHLDVTPEAPGQNVNPIVHRNYDGGDIKLSEGVVLSPKSPQGMHLKNCRGKTIITSDGTTLLGADDKAGVTVLVGLIEMIVNSKKIKHGNLYFVFSQNEDIGRAADRFEAKYVDGSPDIVIDVDGNMPDRFSVENFTASMFTYHFYGHDTHPGDGFVNKYGDALTAASYFIGQIDPVKHPSASKDKQGYIHCYSMTHPTDSLGKEITEDYLVKVRLRYFDKNEGDTLRQMLKDAESLAANAYPFVRIKAGPEMLQYENIAYTMYPGTSDLIIKSAKMNGMTMKPCSERGGTTSAMMAAKGLRGGPCIYSGQQAAHSIYEWVCVEDMVKMIFVTRTIVENVVNMANK